MNDIDRRIEALLASIEADRARSNEEWAKAKEEREKEREEREKEREEREKERKEREKEREDVLARIREEKEKDLAKIREESLARIREEREKDERRWEKYDKMIKNNQKEIGGIANSNGDFAEEYFENVFFDELTFAGMQFHEMLTRKKFDNRIRQDEFDIILLNEKNALIVETKYKAQETDIDALIKKADAFRFWYPEYKEVFLGLASLRFEDNIISKAKKKGIAIIRQLGDKTVVNDENLKAY